MLRDLTEQDLEKIGIQSLGHRRKLLRAIADLKDVDQNMSAEPIAPTALHGFNAGPAVDLRWAICQARLCVSPACRAPTAPPRDGRVHRPAPVRARFRRGR